MKRIEVNVTSGARREIALTGAEIAAAEDRTAAEAQEKSLATAAATRAAKREAAIDALLAEAAKDPDAPLAVKEYAGAK